MIFISSSVSSNYDHNKKDTFETYEKQFPFDNTAKGQMEGTVKLKNKMKNGEKSTDALLDAHRNLKIFQPPTGWYTPRLNFRVFVKGAIVVVFVFFQIRRIFFFYDLF